MLEQTFEGTWEEVVQHADELAGKHVRVTVLAETSAGQPNLAMQETLRKVVARNHGKPLTYGVELLDCRHDNYSVALRTVTKEIVE